MTFFLLALAYVFDFVFTATGFFFWKSTADPQPEPPATPQRVEMPDADAKSPSLLDQLVEWGKSRKSTPVASLGYVFMVVGLCMFVALTIKTMYLASAYIYLE